MAFVSDKQASGLYNNANPFTAPAGALSVADNVTIYKQDEIEGRFPFTRCANGLPMAVPKQLFSFNDSIMTHINDQIWYEYDENCNFKQIPLPGIPLYMPRTFSNPIGDTDTLFMTEDNRTVQRYHDLAKLKISDSFAQTFIGIIGYTETRPVGSDGIKNDARLSYPNQVVCDSTYAYVADCGSATIRRIHKTTGVVETIAGKLNTFGNVDGALGTSLLNSPTGICYDSSTNFLYFFDGNLFGGFPFGSRYRFKKLNLATNVVTTIVSDVRSTIDAYGVYSAFTTPTSQYVYFDCINRLRAGASTSISKDGYAIVRVDKATGASTDFCGDWNVAGSAVGTPANSRFDSPKQICGDQSNTNLYVPQGNRIVKIEVSTGNSSYVFGSGVRGILEGNGVNCQLATPCGLCLIGNTLWIGCADEVYGAIMYADIVTGDVKVYTQFSLSATRSSGFIVGKIQEPVL